MSTISRRDFMKTAGVMTLAVAASAALAGCSTENSSSSSEAPVVTPTASNTFKVSLGHNTLEVTAEGYAEYSEVTGKTIPCYATFTFASSCSSLYPDGSIVKHVEIRDAANKVIGGWLPASTTVTPSDDYTLISVNTADGTIYTSQLGVIVDNDLHLVIGDQMLGLQSAKKMHFVVDGNGAESYENLVADAKAYATDGDVMIFIAAQSAEELKGTSTVELFTSVREFLDSLPEASTKPTALVDHMKTAHGVTIDPASVKTSANTLSFIGNGGFTHKGATDVLIKALGSSEKREYTVYINYGDDNATVSYPISISSLNTVTY